MAERGSRNQLYSSAFVEAGEIKLSGCMCVVYSYTENTKTYQFWLSRNKAHKLMSAELMGGGTFLKVLDQTPACMHGGDQY